MAHRSWSEAIACAFAITLTLAVSRATASEADDLVAQGVELRRAGKDTEALAIFRRAYEIAPTPRVTAQLGLAEQALSKWLDAERDLAAALKHPEDAWIAKNAEPLREALAAVESHLGWLEITCDVPGARVQLGGKAVGETPLPAPLRVVAEPVTIEAEKRGFARVHLIVVVASKQHAKLDFSMTPDAFVPKSAPVDTASTSPPILPLVGGALIGVSIAGIAVGTWFGFRALDWKDERSAHCPEEKGCDPEGLVADRELRSSATASTIAFGAAAVTGVVGVLLVLPAFRRTTVAPTVVTQSVGLTWRGVF